MFASQMFATQMFATQMFASKMFAQSSVRFLQGLWTQCENIDCGILDLVRYSATHSRTYSLLCSLHPDPSWMEPCLSPPLCDGGREREGAITRCETIYF